jgi:selenoprotein W-related protein
MKSPRVEIRYCPACRWLLRASWMAQELLSTFESEIGEVALMPSESGVFQIYADDVLVWCRKRDGGFPDIKELKQRVRDQVAPGKALGHIDRAGSGHD